jgi:hypothetical protein
MDVDINLLAAIDFEIGLKQPVPKAYFDQSEVASASIAPRS